MNIYAVIDKVSNVVFEIGLGDSDASFLRANLTTLTRDKPKNDIKIVRVCSFANQGVTELSSSNFGSFEFVEVDLDKYHFDEIEADFISKTDAVQRIEMYRKSQQLRLQKLQLEIEKQKKELEESK